MDDSSSIASFEEVTRPSVESFKTTEEKNVELLKALVSRSAENGAAVKGLAEDEVLDVCYVLQYKGWGGKLIDIQRSPDPIDIQLHNSGGGPLTADNKVKPVLEIVTKVSTQLIKRTGQSRFNRGPQRRCRQPYDPYCMDDYNDPYLYPGHQQQSEDDSEVKIAKVEQTTMVINSIHLINALKAVVGYYPSVSFVGNSVRISAPYEVLIHHRAALARYKVSQPRTHDEEYAFTTAKHIDVLLSFLDKTLGQQIREEEERHCSSTPKATFDNLWLLLRPGTVIYAEQDHKWTPFVISRVHNPFRSGGDPKPYTVDCWNISYSMDRFSRSMHSFNIDPFSGEEAILNLRVIPGRFYRGEDDDMDPAEVAARQIELGQFAWELAKGPAYMSYEGGLVRKHSQYVNQYDYEASYPTGTTGYMSGRVIVDCQGFERYSNMCPTDNGRASPPAHPPVPHPPPKDQLPYFAPRCGCNACSKDADGPADGELLSRFAGFEDLDPVCDDPPNSDLYFLAMSKVVSGFVLNQRRWGHFNVEDLHDVQFDREAFKYLVLDDDIKWTVKALIGKFASANGQVSPWPSDFVKNKGQGRIFLLHGSPGVGKTCTAEATAELAQRPLLSLTSGDLSTHSYTVEKNLDYFLTLGERFGAIVLLDEADVYLETRRARDIARNGLVSIFLRALEYYRGVLFLTSNRVETFDSAFTSRIHVALHYRPLTDGDREQIWQHGFERLERDSGGRARVGVAAREYAYASADLRRLRWNGREIRNALQTAVALAEADASAGAPDYDGGASARRSSNAAAAAAGMGVGAGVAIVTDKHLRYVVKMSRGFKDFLRHSRQQQQQQQHRGRNDEDDDDGILGREDNDDDVDEEEEIDDDDRSSILYD
ncbi:hypothetical protein SLS62_000325 [Diatrype stigma]|uniref:AAA+ ATPase domain-containing protein n=1 Tax=Diatrype stigma TaxID=117547 RepID=A0AAN9V2M4_9PEZI